MLVLLKSYNGHDISIVYQTDLLKEIYLKLAESINSYEDQIHDFFKKKYIKKYKDKSIGEIAVILMQKCSSKNPLLSHAQSDDIFCVCSSDHIFNRKRGNKICWRIFCVHEDGLERLSDATMFNFF